MARALAKKQEDQSSVSRTHVNARWAWQSAGNSILVRRQDLSEANCLVRHYLKEQGRRVSEKKSQHQLQVSTCVCAYVYPHKKTCMYMHTYDSHTYVKKEFCVHVYTGVQSFFLVTSLSFSVLQIVLASKSMLGSVPHSRMQKKIKLGFSHNTQCFCELQMYGEFCTPQKAITECATSAECALIQLNSDTVYLETIRSHRSRAQSQI